MNVGVTGAAVLGDGAERENALRLWRVDTHDELAHMVAKQRHSSDTARALAQHSARTWPR